MRDFHATPKSCPPPAASADLARRRLLTAVAAAPVAVALPAAAERLSDDADAQLFKMLHQVEARRAEFERLWEEEKELSGGVSDIVWSPEELAQHGIPNFGGRSGRLVSLSVIDDANVHDSPFIFERTIASTDDGVVICQLYKTTRQPCDEAEVAAWRARCAARRALYDEKEKAHKERMAGVDMDMYEKRRDKLLDENSKTIKYINEYQPKTIQGVLEKMRLFYKEHSHIFLEPPERRDESANIFIAALADFERVVSRKQTPLSEML